MEYTNVISIRQEMVPPVVGRHHYSLGGAIAQLFGCKHRKLSRPFTRDRQTYLACLECGMHREFDLETWQARGVFFAERAA